LAFALAKARSYSDHSPDELGWRLRHGWRRSALERELEEEIRFHVDMLEQDQRQSLWDRTMTVVSEVRGLFAAVVVPLTAVLIGLLPAWKASRPGRRPTPSAAPVRATIEGFEASRDNQPQAIDRYIRSTPWFSTPPGACAIR
jgi:hypothetical protein